MMMTIAAWLKNSSLPRLEAWMLLQKATGLSRAALLSHDEDVLSSEIISQLDAWQSARLNGTPMAYLIGSREFFGRDFMVSKDVLIPRPETEHLIEAVLDRLPERQSIRIWDLGTGSGIIAITLKLECPSLEVFASDVSAEALSIAKTNAQNLKAEVFFGEGSWFEGLPSNIQTDKFDFIVSNPPYIDSVDQHLKEGDVRFEPLGALTDFADGLSALRILCEGAPSRLKIGGYILMEHGFDQQEAVQALLRQNGFSDVETITDLAGLPRISLGCWRG